MRRPFIAGNWKMYKTIPEAVDLARKLAEGLADVRDRDIMIAPPFTMLAPVAFVLADSTVSLGAQDVFWEKEGAFTGEVSPGMLKDAGCRHAIIGHSERRQFFGETDQTVNRKVKAALEAGLSAVMCVGETLRERESGKTLEVVGRQVREGLRDLAPGADHFSLAYEPVWAIGTGRTATPDQAQEVHAFLRKTLGEVLGAGAAGAIRILYGGSVKADNIADLMSREDIDGALVGGASLKADSFISIVKF
jgi:triosephosphate isomerase (TIM)